MVKRLKCRVKKTNQVPGDFIHSNFISFIVCPSVVRICIFVYKKMTRSGDIEHAVAFYGLH